NLLSAGDSGSTITSLANAELSRYTYLSLISSQIRQRLGEKRPTRDGRQRPEARPIAAGPRHPPLGDELLCRAGVPQRHDPSHRMAAVGDLDGFAGNDAPDDGARVLLQVADPDLEHAHIVAHKCYIATLSAGVTGVR